MKKFFFALIPLAFLLFSCASAPITTDTIARGAGRALGTVSASASVSENRESGKITGDTLKYGYLVTGDGRDSQAKRLATNSLTSAAETAYANALYEIIQQAKKMGGNALNEVVSVNKRSFDLYAGTETVTVTVTAEVTVK